MTKPSQQAEKKVLDFFGGVLKSTATAAARRKTAEARLAAVASGLAGLQDKIAKLDGRASAAYTDSLAGLALEASTGLATLRRVASTDPGEGTGAAYGASAALDGLAAALVRGADSMHFGRGCGCHDEKAPSSEETARIKLAIGEAAAEVHLAAVAIRDAYRLNTDSGLPGFRFPLPEGVGCVISGDEDRPRGGDDGGWDRVVVRDWQAPGADVDRRLLADALAMADQASLDLPRMFASLAAFLTALPAISLCFSACSPPLSYIGVPTIKATGAESPPGVACWTPFFELSWSYCCQDLCFLFYTDEYLVTVESRHRVLGPGIPFVLNKILAEKVALVTARSVLATVAAGGVGLIAPPNRLDVPVTEPLAPYCAAAFGHHVYI